MDATDKLSQYYTEVLSQGLEALLPQHLPDRWLDHLLEEGDAYLDQGDRASISTLLLSVLALVDYHQVGPSAATGTISISLHDLNDYLSLYVLSLGIEKVSRATDITGEGPTLDNLFDRDRVLRFTRRDTGQVR